MADLFGNFRLAINDSRYFFGRDELISEVVKSPFEVRILLGGRRLGKTSVLNQICWSLLDVNEESQNRALPVLIDLQKQQPTNLDNFHYLLIKELRKVIQNPKQETRFIPNLKQKYKFLIKNFICFIKASIASLNLFGFEINLINTDREKKLLDEEFCQDLINLIKKIHQNNYHGICFIFDNSEYLVKQDWSHDACSYLRSLKDTPNIAINPFLGLFLSGYRDLSDYHQKVGSPLFNMAEIKWLNTLTSSETEQLVKFRFQEKQLPNPTKQTIKKIIKWAGCHPYLTNQMLNLIFSNKYQENSSLDKYLFDDLIRQHRKRDFQNWWDKEKRTYGFGKKEQDVYIALIQERQGTAESLFEKVDLSLEDTEDALEVIAGTGVIRKLDFETYCIGAKIFEKWVTEFVHNLK